MEYIFMAISIVLSVVNACLLRGYSAKNQEENYSPFLFNQMFFIHILVFSAHFLDCLDLYIANFL